MADDKNTPWDPQWNTFHNWRKIIERRLNKLGSMVEGNQNFQSDRILDVTEQIEEVRKEVRELTKRMDEAAKYIKARLPKNGE